MSDWEAPLIQLLHLQSKLERGPKREGAFAVWLTVRTALQIGTESNGEKAERRRVALLTNRLAPLAVPRSLARGLAASLSHLDAATPQAARIALSQLVAPAKEALGSEAAEAVAMAASMIHETSMSPE